MTLPNSLASSLPFHQIPDSLRALPQWVCWRRIDRNGKATKQPLNARTGHPASSTDSKTWSTFDEAVKASVQFDGIGFCFAADGGITGIDLDKCRTTDGTVEEWATDILEELDSYSEVSPSGTGLHIIILGTLPDDVRNRIGYRNGAVEMYSTGRYFCMTGNTIAGYPPSVEYRQPELLGLHHRIFPDAKPKVISMPSVTSDTSLRYESDDEVLERARRAANGAKFITLFDRGDTTEFPSHSEADQALANMLAFFGDKSADQVDRLFRKSALMRPKWADHDGYREATIAKAISDTPHRAAQSRPTVGTHQAKTQVDLLSPMMNDHGNGQRVQRMFGEIMRYCHPFNSWMIFDGKRWIKDDSESARILAKETMIAFHTAAARADNKEARKFAHSSLEAKRITTALQDLRSSLTVKAEELDQNPWLLNFRNGTMNLKTGQLQQHRKEDFITKLVDHEFNQTATCPTWMKFLDRIMGGGPDAGENDLKTAAEMTSYLQRALGYSLTGTTREKAVFMCFGTGNNGKSTMLATVGDLIPEYRTQIQIDTLMTKAGSETNTTQADLADLRGARFVQTSETEEGQSLAAGKLKRITQGMGKIKACRKYENPIEFEETHKLWMDANHKPILTDSSDSTWNRLHVIPFNVVIPPEEIDPDLPKKLKVESEGILAWLVQGAEAYVSNGLQPPTIVMAARDDYRKDQDHLSDFIAECCDVDDVLTTRAAPLQQAYQSWAERNGIAKPLDQRRLKDQLGRKGISQKRGNHGALYLGIGLKHPPSSER
jgi:putative DNA primase/helicase